MNYYYLVETNKQLNKKKVYITIAIVIIILLSIFGAIMFRIKLDEKKAQEEKELIAQEELKLKEKEERIREEQRRLAEEKRLKNANPFTEEQMEAIENIYVSENKRVFLTFDDGPTTTVTPLILDLLKQENIKATFFVLGNRAKANPDLIKREFDEGHYIANHGYSHKYSQIYANVNNVLDEYNYTEACIQEALGNGEYHSKVFRFPGGSVGGYYANMKSSAKVLLRQQGIVSLDWNALSKDAEGAHTRESILENVDLTVGDKQSVVLLMHDAQDKILTYETLSEVIQYFRDRGYEFMNLYDVL